MGFFTDRHQRAYRAQKLATSIVSEMYGGESDTGESDMSEESDASLSSLDDSDNEDDDDEEYFTTSHYTSNQLHTKHNRHNLLPNHPPTHQMRYVMFVVCIVYSHAIVYRQDTQFSVAASWYCDSDNVKSCTRREEKHQ